MRIITQEVEAADERSVNKHLRVVSWPRRMVLLMLVLGIILALHIVAPPQAAAQLPEPVVAIHVSEVTQNLEALTASPPTPTGPGTSGKEWFYTSWHYFVAYESLKEALRSDGTPFVEVSDADIAAGDLLYPDGSPRYPILISLASEAVTNSEIAPLRDYVAAGGFLFVGSSAFTRNPDGTTRGDFALANEMGLHMVNPSLENWYENTTFTRVADHRLLASFPTGTLSWRMPLTSEEIPEGVSPDHVVHWDHYVFQVSADAATVIAEGVSGPLLATRQYGKGNFIYHGAIQPLLGYGGNDPGMYAYLIYRHAIEWAFEAVNLPIIKLSPWRYAYDAAFIVMHYLDNDQAKILSINDSALFEKSNGVKGDYCFNTGTIRSVMTGSNQSNAIAGLQSAVTNNQASIGSCNGGLQNPVVSLPTGSIDYWNWGPDEALDSLTTGTYANGKDYAQASILMSFQDIEGWLTGLDNGRAGCGSAGTCPRSWMSPNFNSTREASLGILQELGTVTAGEQKIGPFPFWTLSTQTTGTHYPYITLPLSDWFVGSAMTSMGGSIDGHTPATMQAAVDFYHNLGALTNIYGHINSTDSNTMGAYVQYAAAKPNMWAANAVGIYDWWKERSNAVVSSLTYTYSTLSATAIAQVTITGATDPDTAIEVVIPYTNNLNIDDLVVSLNGTPTDTSKYRVIGGNVVKILVGNSTSAVEVQYPFQYPVPTTTSLSPAAVKSGLGDFVLTVNGTNFISSSVVEWKGSSRTTTFVSSTQLTAAISASDIATAGTASVTVFNPAPGGGTSNAQTITVDNTAPTAAITYAPVGSYKSGAAVTITATFSEPMADLPVPRIAISGANTLAAAILSKVSTTVYTYAYLVGSGDGTATVALSTGTDLAGNVVTATPTSGGTFTVDNTAPTLVISAPSSTFTNTGPVSYTVTYTGADTVTLAAGNVTMNATGGASGTVGVTGSGNSTRTVTISSIIGNGTLGISIAAGTASDAAGNTALASGPSATFTVDTTAPDTSITSQPTNPSNQTSASFSFTATEAGSTFACQIDGGTYSSCTSTTTYSGLASGQTHTFSVRATDPVGNTDPTPATYSWLIDVTVANPPSVSGTTPTNDTTPTWTWIPGGGGNGNYRIKLDDSNLTTGATTTTATSFTASIQSQGTHTLYVQERSTAGTWSASGSFAIVIDTTAPTEAISAPSSAVGNSSTPVTYIVTYTGADTITLASGDVTLNRTGTANGTAAVSGTGTGTRTITISNITGNGTIGISIAAGTAS